MHKFISGFTLAVIITGCIYYFGLREPSKQPAITTDQKLDHTALVFSLSKKLAYHDPTPLTDTELNQFKNSVPHLNYDQVIKALELMKPSDDEIGTVKFTALGEPRDTSPEAWEPPAEILACRLIELAPIHTSQWIQYSQITHGLQSGLGWRGAVSFIKMFGQTHPELAWQEVKLHYAKFWGIFDEEYRQNIPQISNGVFYSISLRDPLLARQFLLEKSYQSTPYAKTIQSHALAGILRAIEHDPDALIDLLEWLEDDGSSMSVKITGHSFRIDLSPFTSIDHMALALLARINPQRAIDWAIEHDNFRISVWPYAIYAGWVKFWPYTQEGISTYTTRYEDAMKWLVDNTEHSLDLGLIHNAYCQWNGYDRNSAIEWLNSENDSSKLKAIKTRLRTCLLYTSPSPRD